jgi:hypothetical protein
MEDIARTTLFNNAGVHFYNAGLYNEAGELFRAALEETLLFADPDEQLVAHGVSDSSIVRRAEDYVNNMHDLLPVEQSSNSARGSTMTERSSLAKTTTTQESSSSSSSSSPYFYNHPILLDQYPENTSLELTGAVIVNNLAIVHHMKNSSCKKAEAFYTLSEALMREEDFCDPRVLLLQIAVTNNHGVWLYRNDDLAGTNACLERLHALFGIFGPCLPPLVQQGIKANLCWRVETTPLPLANKIQQPTSFEM